MSRSRTTRVILPTLVFALIAPRANAVLDRAPQILANDQVGSSVRLLWAPGGKSDGTLDPGVVSYQVEKRADGASDFTPIFGGDAHAMTYVDNVGLQSSWNWYLSTQQPVSYRIRATTSDSAQTLSQEVTFNPSLPLYPPNEILDGKVKLAWLPSVLFDGCTDLGYQVEKFVGGSWVAAHAGNLPPSQLSFIDANPAAGVNRYRVTAYHYFFGPIGPITIWFTSNEQEIEIHPCCEGQAAFPSLPVIEIGDLDNDGDHDGYDIAAALTQCGALGGCVLRALPVTYDNVAIRITNRPDCSNEASPTHPIQCILAGPGSPLSFASGLVIEGYGKQTVFRSPLWQSLASPVPLPAPVLEVLRLGFRVTLRNLVLDGRKFEQQPPGTSLWHSWWYGGLYVWNTGPWRDEVREIAGDSLGNEAAGTPYPYYCGFESNPVQVDPFRIACREAASGNDGDGKCEAGETCVDGQYPTPGSCDEESFTNAPTCESTLDANDGCIHNVEVRDIPGAYGAMITHANGWIIEDSKFHDIGCVNRGYGYDCPNFDSAADAPTVPPGFKTFGIGLGVGEYTADFKVRRNDVYRVTKYGLSFKNANATDCNGLLRNHEVSYNKVHDGGAVGIFNHGSVGARIHHNEIGKTTTWHSPPSMNGDEGPFGMSLGGYCSDDNEFTDNQITDSGGMGIYWNGSAETVACTSPGSCAPLAAVGNTIRGNTVDGTCLEKDTGPETGNSFVYGSIHVSIDASGPLTLQGNHLTHSNCREAIAVWGPRNASVGALNVRVAGGSYESGPKAATAAQNPFYCGAVEAYGANRKVVIGDDVSITNPNQLPMIPKACLGYNTTLVVDDVPTDPFSSLFSGFQTSGDATVVQCSSQPSHPDCQ